MAPQSLADPVGLHCETYVLSASVGIGICDTAQHHSVQFQHLRLHHLPQHSNAVHCSGHHVPIIELGHYQHVFAGLLTWVPCESVDKWRPEQPAVKQISRDRPSTMKCNLHLMGH